jgi:hypothetical protein
LSGKYSDEQLADMARTVIVAGLRADPRYFHLMVCLAAVTHLSGSEIERRIQDLANKVPAPAG